MLLIVGKREMALKPKLVCSTCGKASRERPCQTCRPVRRKARGPDRRAGSTARGYDIDWQRTRKAHLQEHPLCEDCLSHGRTCIAGQVHHVIKVTVDASKRLDRENLMSLCEPCHARRTAMGE